MCFDVDQTLVVAGLVLLFIAILLAAVRVWVAAGDYLLRRRVALRGSIGRAFDRFEARVANHLLGP